MSSKNVVRLFENITDVWIQLSFAHPVSKVSKQGSDSNLVGLPNRKTAEHFSCQPSSGLTVTPGHHFLDEKGAFRTIADILASNSKIVLADGTLASVTGEYIHYSAETADMFEQAEGYVAQSVGGSHAPHAGGLALSPVYKKGWKTYNFEVEEFHTYIADGVRDAFDYRLAA